VNPVYEFMTYSARSGRHIESPVSISSFLGGQVPKNRKPESSGGYQVPAVAVKTKCVLVSPLRKK